ncbi:MAG: hypothetical protein L0I62_11005 [Gammaproteobacteria bacterium]|nr:hypothetical protein [Gammaproteobacteria bacterium]
MLADMYNDTDLFAFPELPDEAVVALNQFIESFYTHFQNHYFAQIHRCYHEIDQRQQYNNQLPLPLDDPPF